MYLSNFSMPDPLIYQHDNFVILETNQPEQFLTASELLEKLKVTLEQLKLQDLPPDVQKLDTPQAQAQYLLDTTCELDVGPGKYFQWYAVRLEK
jgi:hypothetical protein